jgi:hypothetical protein
MKNKNLAILTAAVLLFGSQTGAWGGDPTSVQTQSMAQDQVQDQQKAYGWQLMTPEELATHRAKMRSFTTQEEREKYRMEHHKLMQERAKAQGVTLPDEPAPFGMGPGRGMGPGGGMGSGR